MQLRRMMITALMLPLALTCSTSCVTRYQYIKQQIPAQLLEPCDMPELNGDTYGDVVRLAYRQRVSLAECSARLTSIEALTKQE